MTGPDLTVSTQSQTQNNVSASSQSLRFILSLRMNSSFITSRPGQIEPGLKQFDTLIKLLKGFSE